MNYKIEFLAERRGDPKRLVPDVARLDGTRVACVEQLGVNIFDIYCWPELTKFNGSKVIAAKSMADAIQRSAALGEEVRRFGFELGYIKIGHTSDDPA